MPATLFKRNPPINSSTPRVRITVRRRHGPYLGPQKAMTFEGVNESEAMDIINRAFVDRGAKRIYPPGRGPKPRKKDQ